jgi:hypothetical protein
LATEEPVKKSLTAESAEIAEAKMRILCELCALRGKTSWCFHTL